MRGELGVPPAGLLRCRDRVPTPLETGRPARVSCGRGVGGRSGSASGTSPLRRVRRARHRRGAVSCRTPRASCSGAIVGVRRCRCRARPPFGSRRGAPVPRSQGTVPGRPRTVGFIAEDARCDDAVVQILRRPNTPRPRPTGVPGGGNFVLRVRTARGSVVAWFAQGDDLSLGPALPGLEVKPLWSWEPADRDAARASRPMFALGERTVVALAHPGRVPGDTPAPSDPVPEALAPLAHMVTSAVLRTLHEGMPAGT